MEGLFVFGILTFIAWILWKSRKLIWAVLLFSGALIVLVAWEGILANSPELALGLGLVGAVIGAWRFTKKRI